MTNTIRQRFNEFAREKGNKIMRNLGDALTDEPKIDSFLTCIGIAVPLTASLCSVMEYSEALGISEYSPENLEFLSKIALYGLTALIPGILSEAGQYRTRLMRQAKAKRWGREHPEEVAALSNKFISYLEKRYSEQ